MSAPLFIAGMHRSGTSLTAQWLMLNGLFIGETLLSGFKDNKYGHFEDVEFLSKMTAELTVKGLHESGTILTGQHRFDEFSQNVSINLKVLTEKRNAHHITWGWKEPRSTLFLAAWKKLIPSLKVVAVFRKPELVVASLYKRLKKNKWYKTLNPLKNLWWYLDIDMNANKWVKIFSNTYRIYNKAILDFQRTNPDDIILVDIDQLPHVSDQVMNWVVTKTGLLTVSKPFSEVMDASVMTQKIDIQVSPEARQVYKELQDKATYS